MQSIGVNDVVSFAVDPDRKKIDWYKNKRLIVNRALPESMVGMDLFPFLTMLHKEDEV